MMLKVIFVFLLFLIFDFDALYAFASEKSKVEVILARHQEPMKYVKWVKKFPHIIYNRGPLESGFEVNSTDSKFKIVDISSYANCGQEAYIFLCHIIHNYDDLAEINVFASPRLKLESDTEQVIDGTRTYSEKNLHDDIEKLISAEIKFRPENDGFFFFVPYCICLEDHLGSIVHNYNSMFGADQFDVLWDGFKDLVKFNLDHKKRFSPGFAFAVTKEAILRRPKKFYFDMAKSLMHEVDSPELHFFRRSWWAVFKSTCQSKENYNCHYDPSVTCSY